MKFKKLMYIFNVLLLANFLLFGEEKLSKVDDRTNEYSEGVYILNGFGFDKPENSSHNIGLDEYVDAEIRDILQRRKGNSSEYTIVGYSEGGLRALAYAKRLKEQDEEAYKKLKAVITVSGIDKGLKAMQGCSEINGFTPLKSKIREDVDIIYNGIVGFVFGMPTTSLVLGIFGGITLWDNKDDVIDSIKKMMPYLDGYIGTALKDGSYSELAEIYDMMPNSNFINDNVATTESVLYKKKVGETYKKTTKTTKILGGTATYVVTEKVPEYKTYVAYKDAPRFDSELPVGYIVGTDNNSLGMLDEDTESAIRKGASAVSTAMYVAQGVNIARLIASLGICPYYGTCASYCEKAGKWFGDIDKERNDLLGSDKGDGLVAKESQFYPTWLEDSDGKKIKPVHPKVLSNTKNGYVTLDYNHIGIDPTKNLETKKQIKEMLRYADKLKEIVVDEK